jgi:hypothetical protein
MFEHVPDGYCEAAAGPQYSEHLSDGSKLILKKHQSELADHTVEAITVKRKRLGPPLPPLNFGRFPFGHRKHPFIEIKAHYRPTQADSISDGASKDTRAARDIKDSTCPFL